jgi:phosphoglucomutase/phosphopentomutase
LAIECATENGCQLVFANDPDADRFAVAEFNQSSSTWTQFTGNQLGIILGSFVFDQFRDKNTGKLDGNLACITTSVSSHMLQSFCELEGVLFAETLTGFKWLGNKALDMESNQMTRVVFAFEEAIGFMCGTTVYDKDGVSALGLFYTKAMELYNQETPQTISQYLDSLYIKYGAWVSNNSYIICKDPQLTARIFDKIRYSANPKEKQDSSVVDGKRKLGDIKGAKFALSYPEQLAGVKVTQIRDLTIGYDSSNPPTYSPSLPISSSSQMLTFRYVFLFTIMEQAC